MTRIMIFTSPAWLPFVLLGHARALWFAAGAEWSQPEAAALCCIGGGIAAGIVAILMVVE